MTLQDFGISVVPEWIQQQVSGLTFTPEGIFRHLSPPPPLFVESVNKRLIIVNLLSIYLLLASLALFRFRISLDFFTDRKRGESI